MSTANLLRSISALASGKRISVRAHGILYVLPAEPPPAPVGAPNAVEVAAAKLLESDAASRALLESVSATFAQAFGRVDETVQALAAGHAEVVASVRENTRTLHLPVKPVYDKDGKVVAAQRVKA